MQDLPVPQRSLTLPEPATREGSTRPTGLPAAPTGPHRPLFQPIADVAPGLHTPEATQGRAAGTSDAVLSPGLA